MAHRVVIACLAALLCVACVVSSSGESLKLDLGTFAPDIESTRITSVAASNHRAVKRLQIPGCSSCVSSGDPALPCRLLYIALPPNADDRCVKASMDDSGVSELPGVYDVAPVPAAITADGTQFWGHGKSIKNGRNELVYTKDKFYPSESVRIRSIGRLRTWKILELEVWPCRYNPVSGKLRVLESAAVTIDYSITPAASVPDAAASDMASFIANPDQARQFYLEPDPSAPIADYAIITTSAIASSSTKLAAFASYRQSRGYKVRIVTEAAWGGGTGDVAANNIRRWLRDNYLGLGLRYILLIGDPGPSTGSVPMKLLWPRRHETCFKDAASDYYYADLTGNWDLDGDGYYGEEPDDLGLGGIDRIPELYVGRIPFYGSITALDSILQKTMDYESATLGAWSRNFLLPMKALDLETPCYQLGEEISQDIALPLSINPRRLYDTDYGLIPPPERIPCDYAGVLSDWQTSGAGMVTWMTHGSPTLASGVFSSDRCALLDDTRPAIVFSASCDNGWPENPDNLGYSLLCTGAVCVQSSSRASFYYPRDTFKNTDSIGGMAYEFARYLLDKEQTCGRAAYESRLSLPFTIWANHLVFNVYGDPAVSFNASALGSAYGRVLDRNGQPIPFATIRTPDGSKQVRCASDGTYRVNGLGVTSLDLIASASGYYSQRYYDLPISIGAALPLDFHLQPAVYGSVLGHIRDESGSPIVGASVVVSGAERGAVSLADGSFCVSGVEPGLYSLLVSKSPYAERQVSDCLVTEGQSSSVEVTLHVHIGNVLVNGGFEAGFPQALASGWQRYSIPAGYGNLYAGYDQRYAGSFSQKIGLPQPFLPDSRIGIYQTAPVLSGWSYDLSVWQRDYVGIKESDPAANVICRLGCDPNGGTDPSSPRIIWREFSPTHAIWNSIAAAAVTSGASMTIFLEGVRKLTTGGNNCYAWFDVAALTGPREAPATPNVTLSERWVTPDQAIEASWADASVGDSLTYEYAVAESPAGVGIVPGGQWRNAGSARSASVTGLTLRNGALIYVLVRATNSAGAVSEIGASQPIRVVDAACSIPAAKLLPDGTWVKLDRVLVSRMGDVGECFVQSIDGIGGIWVRGAVWNVPFMVPGTRATVLGCLGTQSDIRAIVNAEIIPSYVQTAPRALGMLNAHVGGCDYHYTAGPPVSGQKGRLGGRGPNTVGLLVAVWGRVRSSSAHSFIIDDGTLPNGLLVTCLGSAQPPQGTPYVRLTGIAGPRGVFVCSEDDITVLY